MRGTAGPEGYELCTFCDPFGTGFNIIHIGYSNPEGLTNTVEVFLGLLTNPLPGLMNIEAHQLPMQPDEVRKITPAPIGSARYFCGASGVLFFTML
jgi:hypothetical protein